MTKKKRCSHNRSNNKSYQGGESDVLNECAICLKTVNDKDRCTSKCQHNFHLHCILQAYEEEKVNRLDNCILCYRDNIIKEYEDIVANNEESEPLSESTSRLRVKYLRIVLERKRLTKKSKSVMSSVMGFQYRSLEELVKMNEERLIYEEYEKRLLNK